MPQRVSSATAALLPPVLLPSPAGGLTGPTVLPLRAPSFEDQVICRSSSGLIVLTLRCTEGFIYALPVLMPGSKKTLSRPNPS